MSKRTAYIVFALAAAAFAAFAVLMEHAPDGPVRVRVDMRQTSGYGFVHSDTIKAYVERRLANVPPDSVPKRLSPLEKHIVRDPYVEKAVVYRRPSGEVRVELWEEIPSFRLITDTGNYYVGLSGRMMPVRVSRGVDIPIVSGQADKDSFEPIRRILHRIEQDDFLAKQAVGLRVSRRMKNGRATYDYSIDTRLGMEIRLGQADDLDVKFENFGIIYAYLYSSGKTDAYKVVNLEFGNYVICKKK